ncbi:hypothetical protein EGI16_21370 [Chryseobacterium sp. G0240]|uniref:hypothetical protein n=1 Tax=Chryseobacterium sp. G0240 TaxID=2487066 RepID=UPI000F45A013|nr:hypothetical protein [Chryseobacterium sp. G0240]ROH98388.1 hypothetical protein EGI16_21370 [Chryseobacterium sp. G0240]
MILSFSRQIDGKPTYFPEKIIAGLYVNNQISKNKATELFNPQVLEKIIPEKYQEAGKVNFATIHKIEFDNTIYHRAKIHTIREDKTDRWKDGTMIDFFINARQKNMFRFAPRFPVISTQFIGIYPKTKDVIIDGKHLFPSEIDVLAVNDGFFDYYDFFEYFNEEFHGKIIHWTNLTY